MANRSETFKGLQREQKIVDLSSPNPPVYTLKVSSVSHVFCDAASDTGGAGGREEGRREREREEKRSGAELPAPGEPSQSDACSAQGSHHAGDLPLPALQTGNHHLTVDEVEASGCVGVFQSSDV